MAALSLGGKRSSATFASGAPRSATCRRERAPVASRLLLVVHTGSEAAVGEGARRLLHSSRSSRLDLRSCWSSEPTLSSARVRDARSPPGAATRASVGLPRLRSRTSADAHLTAPPPAADPWGGPPDPLRYQLQGAGSTHGQVGTRAPVSPAASSVILGGIHAASLGNGRDFAWRGVHHWGDCLSWFAPARQTRTCYAATRPQDRRCGRALQKRSRGDRSH